MTEADLSALMKKDADEGRARWRRANGLGHGREYSAKQSPSVSARRKRVAEMSKKGMTVKAISAALKMNPNTVVSDRMFARAEGWM